MMRPSLAIAIRSLRRNRLQTGLTVLGMTIGVAAVLAMIAIGTGAESAIEDQIRAAGMNLIIVTAGNYKVKSTEDFGGGAVEPSAALRLLDWFAPALLAHPEDDPMEKHDHPTARQRLGDSEAGLRPASRLRRPNGPLAVDRNPFRAFAHRLGAEHAKQFRHPIIACVVDRGQ